MILMYTRWIRSIISKASEAHQATLPDVYRLEDPELLALYDRILAMLTGPSTIQVRRNPGLLVALRIRGAQRAFALSVHHHQALRQLEK